MTHDTSATTSSARKPLLFIGLAALLVVAGLAGTGAVLANGGQLAASMLAVAHGAHGSPGGGVGGGHAGMIRFISELDLDEEQLQHLEAIHGIVDEVQGRIDPSAHAQRILGKLESGQEFDPAEARALVDQHLEQMRVTAYSVTDELTALANSLDDSQRALLAEHMRDAMAAHEDGEGHAAHMHRMLGHLHGG
jgi:Spy/CpxP family protein refolding chaperone